MAANRKVTGSAGRKTRYGLLSAAVVLAISQFGTPSASATNFTWNNNQGTDIWSTSDTNWTTTGTNNVVWTNGTTDQAVFNLPTPANVSLTIPVTGTRAITFDSSGWTLSNGGGTLSNASGGKIGAYTGYFDSDTDTIAAPIVNTGGTIFVKAGWGTVTLSGANTYTGTTIVFNGTLRLDASTGTIVSTSGLTLDGSTFIYDNTNSANVAMSQTMGALVGGGAVTEGGEGTVINIQGNASSSTLTFASSSLSAVGSSVNFISGGSANTNNEIKITTFSSSGGAFFNGADYAVKDPTGGFIRAAIYGTGGDANFITADITGVSTGGSNTSNYLVTTTSIASQGIASAQTIKFGGQSPLNMSLATGTTVLSLGSSLLDGGILRSGGGSTTISGPVGASIALTNSTCFSTNSAIDTLTLDLKVTGTPVLIKTGAGTLFMTANAVNTYGQTGSPGIISTFIDNGILSIVQNSNLGAQGDTVIINGGTLQATASFGLFNGSPGTNNRILGLLNNATIDVTGSNTLTVAGVIQDASGSNSGDPGRLIKTGTGTLLLTAADSYAGGTMVNNGTLKLDANTGSLTGLEGTGNGNWQNNIFGLGGGTFDYDNTNSAAIAKSLSMQSTTAALTFVAGDSTVENVQGNATASKLTFPSLMLRTPGASGNFVFVGGAGFSTTNGTFLTGVATGFINQGLFFNGADYAYMNGTSGFVRAPVYGVGGDANFIAADTSGAALADSATSNYLVTTTSIGSQTTGSAKTIKFGGGVNPVNMTLAPAATLTLASGGILVSGNTTTTITGSSGANITAGSNVEFVFRTDVAADNLTIDAPILANGVNVFTKSGAGTLTMTGNAVNTYTGGTFVDGGILSVSQNSNLGDPGTGAAVTINNSTLQATSSLGLFNGSAGLSNRAVNLENDATFDVTTGQTLTIAGVVASVPSYPGHLIKTSAGTLLLSGVNTYAGATTVNGGTLSIASTGSLNSTTGVVLNGGNFNYNSATAYTQPLSFGTGGTISGTGTISASGGITAGTNATVSPGNGVASPGSQSYTTGLTFNTGSTYQWNNNEGNTAGVVGANFSSIVNGGGTVTVSGGTLALDFNATTDFVSSLWSSSHTWDIISGGSVTGSFANITLSGSSLSLVNNANTLSQGTFSDAVTGGDLILTWTPTAGGGVPAGTGTWHNGTSDGKWTTNTGSGNNWLTGIPNGIDQIATFDDTALGGPGTVDLDGDKTVGGLNLNTALVGYTLGLPSTANTLTLQNSSGTALIAVGNNTGAGAAHTINALLNLASNTSVTLATGTSLNLVGTVSGTGTLSVSGTGVLKLSAAAGNAYAGTNVSGGTLLVANTSGSATGSANVVMTGGTLGGSGIITGTVDASSGTQTIFPSATLATTSTTTLTVGGLTTNGTTTLQFNLVTPGNTLNSTVSNSDRIVVTGSGGLVLNGGTVNLTNHSTGAASLGFYKVMSINGGIGGTGLSSLTLPATANNVDYTFDTTHDPGFVDIHRGFLGDVDDSGFVDINDLATLAAHWQQPGGWAQGNFLGDAVVDINDLSVLAAHWQTGITSFGEAADSLSGTSESFQQAVSSIVFGGASSVPEPTSLALLGMGAAGLLARRRNRR